MTSSIRILVVDDDFGTLEFLRSILALAQDDFEVLGVSTAEEALLALERGPFQLLIADVRLPGMNGIEMVQKAWELYDDLPVIMITAYTLSEVDEEVDNLGVHGYFRKPLDAEDFLDAVFNAIEPDEVTPFLTRPAFLKPPDAVAERLDTLRTDAGARQVILATSAGELLYIGGVQPDFDLVEIVGSIASIVSTSLRLANELEQVKPLSVQFLSGDSVDLYFTNIDREYFIAIFIDAQEKRGRIGSLWVFTQRAVKDIRELLIEKPEQDTGKPQPVSDEGVPGLRSADVEEALTAALELEEEFLPAGEGLTLEELDEPVILPAASKNRSDLDESVQEDQRSPLPDDQFEDLMAQLDDPPGEGEADDEDVEAFWEDAADSGPKRNSSGLTLDEARDQGLIGSDFDDKDE